MTADCLVLLGLLAGPGVHYDPIQFPALHKIERSVERCDAGRRASCAWLERACERVERAKELEAT